MLTQALGLILLLIPFIAVPQNNLKPKINTSSGVVAYINGQWYDGNSSFEEKHMYSIAGVFVKHQPEHIDTTIDLEGNFVIPPFGEGHNHSVEGTWTIGTAKEYLKQGVFYYKNPNNLPGQAAASVDLFNHPGGLDVAFAHGGLTIKKGHPEPLYRRLAKSYRMNPDHMEGKAFYTIQDVKTLDRKWPVIISNEPDWIKLYLGNALNKGDGVSSGLERKTLKAAIGMANQFAIPTTVHIESADDLEIALEAGAMEAAHLPGRDWRMGLSREDYHISDELIEKMAARDFTIVTTTVVTEAKYDESHQKDAVQQLQAENIRRLYVAGVPLAIGTDSWGKTALDEVLNLVKIKALSAEEAIKIWIETGPRSVFPRRAIGKLVPAYEASFLVFNCNPLDDLECVQNITMMVKQGSILDIPDGDK